MLQLRHNTLHIIDTLWLGGAQTVVKTIFERNTSAGLLHLVVLRKTKEMKEIHHPNVHCVNTSGKWDLRSAYRELSDYIKKHRILTLHCHLPKSQLMGLLLKRFRYPYLTLIFHEQGDIMDPRPINKPVYLLGRRHIDKVICCSGAVCDTLLQRTRLDKYQTGVIHNFAAVDAVARQQNTTTSSKINIGFAGRITRHKGWQDFIEAISLVRKETKELRVHIAGTGPDMEQLQKMLHKEQLGDCTTLYGFVNDMPAFYRELGMLCVPSHREPMGMVHLEAMHYGVPVIAANVPGMNEILRHEHNALLFEPQRPQQIKEAILRLVEDTTLGQKLVTNGYLTDTAYNYEHFEEKLNQIYAGLSV